MALPPFTTSKSFGFVLLCFFQLNSNLYRVLRILLLGGRVQIHKNNSNAKLQSQFREGEIKDVPAELTSMARVASLLLLQSPELNFRGFWMSCLSRFLVRTVFFIVGKDL